MSTLAFDKYAANYDAHFSRTAIGLQQRKRVHRFLFPLLNKNQSVLEINCGTGEDALEISHRVKEVLATDISAGMVEQAALKTGEVHPNLQFKVCDLKNLPLELRDSKYDLLFSNFGGLNCIAPQELKLFAKNISSHVTAGGRLALVVMGRRCVWENLYFLIKKDTRLYRRRSQKGVLTEIAGEKMFTYYYSPQELSDAFRPYFKPVLCRPIGLFIPPSFLNNRFKKPGLFFSILLGLEKLFGGIAAFSDHADHYMMILEKNNGQNS